MQTQIPAQTPGNPYNLVGDAATPVQPAPQAPVQVVPEVPQVQIPVQPVQVAPVAPAQISVASAPVAPTEGFLEKLVKGIVKFIAKASGNADPLTGQAPVVPTVGNIPTAPAPSTGIFGQIGGALSGIAETAQGMVSGAVAGPQQAPAPTPMPPVPQAPVQVVPQAPVPPVAPQA